VTPLKQIYRHSPPLAYGDCFRTCIASLLDYGYPMMVPHFCSGKASNDGVWVQDARKWLALRKLTFFEIPFDLDPDELLAQSKQWFHGHWLMTAESKNGVGHCLICLDGKIVHNPALDAEPDDIFSRAGGYTWAGWLSVL